MGDIESSDGVDVLVVVTIPNGEEVEAEGKLSRRDLRALNNMTFHVSTNISRIESLFNTNGYAFKDFDSGAIGNGKLAR